MVKLSVHIVQKFMFLEKNEIVHTVGEPERPQSNSLIERQVQEVKRGARALLLHAKHSLAMWPYAMRTFIFNRNHRSEAAQFDPEHVDRQLLQYGQTAFYRAREDRREKRAAGVLAPC